MSKEIITLASGEVLTILTGAEANAAVLRVARECAANGGKVAAEVVKRHEALELIQEIIQGDLCLLY